MKYSKKFLTLIFAMFLLIGSAVIDASAQRRGGVGRGVYRRPVVVRRYIVRDPFWYWNYWGDAYSYDPYLSERRLRYNLQRELSGNKEELRKHLDKYNADGVLTDKEKRELDDDYRDVERSEQRLKEFNRNN
jgi:hypothetical protein